MRRAIGGGEPQLVYLADYYGLSHNMYSELFDEDGDLLEASNTIERIAAGWPLRAFEGRVKRTQGLARVIQSTPVEAGLRVVQIDWLGLKPTRVPYHPIWPGFLINTLFYAAIWLGLFFVMKRVSRHLRSPLGRCPRCRYDLRGDLDAGCPECGWGRGEVVGDEEST